MLVSSFAMVYSVYRALVKLLMNQFLEDEDEVDFLETPIEEDDLRARSAEICRLECLSGLRHGIVGSTLNIKQIQDPAQDVCDPVIIFIPCWRLRHDLSIDG